MLDAQALLQNARKRQLRHGEIEALSIYISRLEREINASQVVRREAASDRAVQVALADDGIFAVTFPGAKPHSVRVRPDLLGEFLRTTLRERQGKPSFVASAGAPTQADLEALARASKKTPTKAKPETVDHDLSLEELGL